MWSTILSIIVVINELMASNAGKVMSPATNFDSWIELYNPSEQAVNLGGMYLSNDASNLKYWQLPNNFGTIPAKGFKVVWLGSNNIKSDQAPFKLDCDGGTIYLSDKNGNMVTSQEYPKAMSRTAWALKTDGGSEWGWTDNATPGESNATAQFATERLAAPVVNVDSKLFKSSQTVKVTIPEGAKLMYTTDGSLPVSLEGVNPWKDWVKNGDCEGTDATCLVTKNGNNNGRVNRITDGVGVDGSRGVKVHSVANAANDWTTQFFVYTPDHTWSTGEKFRFRMMVRADKAATITNQAQKTPGENITNNVVGGSFQVTTEWKEFVYEGTLTKEQAGEQQDWGWGWGWGGGTVTYSLQTIAFNLNKDKSTDNNFYFDDISWESLDNSVTSQESENGVFNISETTNFTFRLFKDGYLPSVPVTRSYIKASNNYTLPVISIVGDKRYFTDPKIGFDCDGDGTNGKTGNGQDQPKNYNQDWDRPVNFSYMSADGKMLFNQDVNISASGGYTRSLKFRSFKLKSSKVFDDQNQFDYSFFPQKPYIRSKVLLIRNGGNDNWRHNARFFDAALETIIQRSGLDLDVQSYVPVIEYVNGELRGVFNMREPNNDKYAYANWGYDDEELDAFENLEMKNGNDSVIKRIFELGKLVGTDNSAYEEMKTLLDIDEFTNYMAVTFFLYNDDWPDNNIKAYRSRNDGRYRFISFDLDYAFKGCWNYSDNNPFTNFVKFKDTNNPRSSAINNEIVNLFLDMLNNDEYRKKFIDTYCVVGGSVFEPTRAAEIVDELLAVVNQMCNLMKQQGLNDGHDASRSATTIKNELKGRSKKMTSYLKDFSNAKLSKAAQAVTVKSNTEGSSLFVNGIEVPYGEFDGYLFAPVKLKVKAPAGYRFVAWKDGSSIVSNDTVMTMPESSTVSLTAVFEALDEENLTAQGITPVRVNEVSAANGIYVNEYFKRNDWVELYNTTDEAIDVEGMYLTDNLSKPTKYQITKGNALISTIIPAHGYLIIWCDKLESTGQLHAQFKLDADGGTVMLTAADQSWSDCLTYAQHQSDQTVGRFPDGQNDVFVMNIPTIANSNIASSYMVAVPQPEKTTDIDEAQISNLNSQTKTQIFNLAGQPVDNPRPGSYYIARVTDSKGHVRTYKFIKK